MTGQSTFIQAGATVLVAGLFVVTAAPFLCVSVGRGAGSGSASDGGGHQANVPDRRLTGVVGM